MPTRTQILFAKTETVYFIFSNYKNAWLGSEMKVKRQPVVQSHLECAVGITIGKKCDIKYFFLYYPKKTQGLWENF